MLDPLDANLCGIALMQPHHTIIELPKNASLSLRMNYRNFTKAPLFRLYKNQFYVSRSKEREGIWARIFIFTGYMGNQAWTKATTRPLNALSGP
ncbi:hypothetical protein [Glaciimonas immobilis]|uniref:Uncharacterized protein n=1 Tax=Glaciimonas immobilis TaxID=728004 RepID=A0A840RTE5_9BURK|nr:hypothetical protein [Glaciimonas immobilis]KAF3999830.1 hypothetical protein HAV38_01175 [Glaciimonas immobilis]MBB5200308.1 hypothetical protein [Glaciimonas immobilis]